jgi:hypothetical protein
LLRAELPNDSRAVSKKLNSPAALPRGSVAKIWYLADIGGADTLEAVAIRPAFTALEAAGVKFIPENGGGPGGDSEVSGARP